MFSLTSHERKVLIFIGILILCGAVLKLLNIKSKPAAENISQTADLSAKITININNASLEELEKIPGIGPEIGRRIIDYRKAHGAFKTHEDLKKVKGIGDKKLKSIRDCISF
jgi:comEA protein